MRKLCIFACCFALAVLAFVYVLPQRTALLLAGAAAVCCVAVCLLRGRLAHRVAIGALGFAAGILWCAGYGAIFLHPANLIDGQTRSITARVVDYPMETAYGASVTVKIPLDNRSYTSVLYLDADALTLEPGDSVRCVAQLSLANGDVDGDSVYYRSRGVYLVAKLRGQAQYDYAEKPALGDWPVRLGHALKQQAAALLSDEATGFLTALLTGDRSGLSYADRNSLSIAGIYHAVAVSGMHVSILLGVLLLLCGSNRLLGTAIGIPVVLVFILMVGGTPSAVRAGCMQILLLLAPLFRRENDSATSLSAALLILLVENPWSICNVGLQLSFASVAGILLFARPLCHRMCKRKWLEKLLAARGIGWLVNAMTAALACSLASMVFSMPLAAAYFGMVSVIAPVTNALALWAVTVCFVLGLAACMAGFVCLPAAAVLAWPVEQLCGYILWLARTLAKIPCAAVYPQNPYLLLWSMAFYGAVTLLAVVPSFGRKRLLGAGVLGYFCLSLLLAYADFHAPDFTFTALDVGQGQCLIYGSGSFTAVIDCGGSYPEGAGEGAVRFLQSVGEYQLEVLALTHYDQDHAGGAQQLLQRERVELLVLPDIPDESGLRDALLQTAAMRGTKVLLVSQDTQLAFSGGSLQIFAPVSDKTDNDSGICVLASAAGYDILVTGDLSLNGEYRLMSGCVLPDIDLLVAGHHGSKTSTSAALLQQVQPETVLISVGEGNSYGHPTPETLDRIAAVNAAVYRTDQCGTITIRG